MNNKKRTAYAAILFTITVWGISLINTKIAMEYYNSISISFWRTVIASATLFILKMANHPEEKMKKEDRKTFLIAGASGVFFYFIFQNTGLIFISASLTSIILGIIPIITMIVEAVISRNKLNLVKVASVFISLAGVCLIVGFETGTSTRNIIIGSLLILMSVFSWVAYTFSTKSLSKNYAPISILFYQTLIGMVLLGFLMPFNWSSPLGTTLTVNFNLAYLGIICSAVAYSLYNYALNNLNATVCNIFINLLPAVSIVTGILVLDETITAQQIFGTVLILFSIYFITKDSEKENAINIEKIV
ncbi:Permease of the drug/metabolite transporter (DMT) superfamily [Dethiosulfatibacter aminovorans DSM 17477]|uniref:Permease of the drug/metabolite transporter (DMT) superfamily n=1 Tax=Dethiosulfatibacter aminovorans DSM 17477 TaxID=1121476 RepID=A0A1M6GTE6_9FIRM|nr:DMT family transporter [Dethiosulfatibacter aminovorans]SHJ13142.1 Permease of the drug/metabolite transporter (DMT) superfamily [Dethiosulfatibacter aminovorans DSM 17477]